MGRKIQDRRLTTNSDTSNSEFHTSVAEMHQNLNWNTNGIGIPFKKIEFQFKCAAANVGNVVAQIFKSAVTVCRFEYLNLQTVTAIYYVNLINY